MDDFNMNNKTPLNSSDQNNEQPATETRNTAPQNEQPMQQPQAEQSAQAPQSEQPMQQPQAEQPAQAPQSEQPQAEEPRTPFQTPVQHPEFRQAQQQTGFGEVPPMSQKPHTPKNKKHSRGLALGLCGVAAACLLFAGGAVVGNMAFGGNANNDSGTSASTSDSAPTLQINSKPESDSSNSSDNYDTADGMAGEDIYKKVNPSVVSVISTTAEGTGSGSGVIMSKDGYIITNAHVLTNGKSFRVIMSDETEYPATVIGKDNKTDLAVIKIEGSGFPAAVMGNSDEVVLGESVVAIGNPAGLSGSVTNGIVSGLNRQIRSDATGFDMNCIQTNAAISPGNSGGALVNMYGQVIGITSSKYVSSSYEGLGFAITINEVLPIVQDLIDNGYVADRVRVGITFISLIPEEVRQGFADEIGMKTVPDNLSGVWITEIADDCDIASTDLQVNDVIVSVQGEAVDDYDSLNAAIAGLKGGDTIEARCRRYQPDGNFEEFSIQCKLMADTSGNY